MKKPSNKTIEAFKKELKDLFHKYDLTLYVYPCYEDDYDRFGAEDNSVAITQFGGGMSDFDIDVAEWIK